ncbi:hypothetical protein ACFYWX_00325 [Streptomyces sp. NPDC002888]|uniref:hypothetical protein n=1 Tax=Streptomyces sp. NPDC002888 TaxID=3364668 RepID=UPI00367434D1
MHHRSPGHDTLRPVDTRSPSEIRAERRRLIESIRAHRRLLAKRPSFEQADQRRLNREARDHDRAETAHGKALQRIHERRARQETSLNRQLSGLDGKREHQEKQALAVLRRESIERSLAATYLSASQVNGIGSGLVRDLAAQGVRTAADFKRVSWGTAPNGKGGQVLYIHRTKGGKVHINGIGEHRGRPLMEWRQSAVARAEARAPHVLPPDERHRIAEIIEAERTRLQKELADVPGAAEAARTEAVRLHADALEQLAASTREAALRADERRAEFDAMAEQLLALQAQLSAHIDQYGDVGRLVRRAQVRALRPLPEAPALPAIPSPRIPDTPARPRVSLEKAATVEASHPTPGIRASLGWLVPIVFLGLTAILGVGETDATAPTWFRIATRLAALAMTAELLRLWVPRRRWRTANRMPSGTGPLATGVFFALVAASMFADTEPDGGASWAASVVSLVLVVVGTALRAGKGKGAEVSN